MKKVDLTKGNVFTVILTLAIPIMGSSFLQFSYSIIDMFWVGKLGSNAVAAVGTTSFLTSLAYSISSMVVIGVGVKVAQSIGKGNSKDVKEFIKIGIILTLLIGIIYSGLVFIFRNMLISIFIINNNALVVQTRSYLSITCIVIIFSILNMMYSRVLNSFGNNKLALKISVTGIVINIILDPILIYGLKIGVNGAAISTLIAQIIMFLLFNFVKSSPFKYDRTQKLSMEKVAMVVKLGFPMAMQRSLFTLVNIFLGRLVAEFGVYAMAAQKIGLQVESITYMIVGGVNGAISAFTGQNYGKGELKRVDKGYNSGLIIACTYAFITTIIFLIIPDKIASLFVSQKETVKIAADYLKIVGLAQIFSAMEVISNAVFTGLGKPKIPSLISIIFTILRIPMAILLAKIFGVIGIWMSIAISSFLKGVVAVAIYQLNTKKKLLSNLHK